MSNSKRKSQAPLPPPAGPPVRRAPPPPPRVRVGDLLWCRERRRHHFLWWPAMVTYEPNQAILVRTTARGVPQVHVQYFGISALRGWVSTLDIEPLVNTKIDNKPLHVSLGKALKAEFDMAIEEVSEALSMSHKERKLKFIFSFESQCPKAQGSGRSNVKNTKKDGKVDQESGETGSLHQSSRDGSESQKRLGKRRKQTDGDELPEGKKTEGQSVHRTRRREEQMDAEMVVSLDISGLGAQLDSRHQPSFKTGARGSSTLVNGLVSDSQCHSKAIKLNSCHVHIPILGKRELQVKEALFELAGPAKRFAADPGSESGSEVSGVSIASAILTPPSSGTETPLEEDNPEMVGKDLGTSEGEGEGEVEGGKRTGEREGEGDNAGVEKAKSRKNSAVFQDGECVICDSTDSNLLACQGHCCQLFHIDCIGLMRPPRTHFVCDECQTSAKECFVCSLSVGTLEKCFKPKCTKFYHRSCVQDNSLFVFDSHKNKFTCPLHSCAKCVCKELDPALSPSGSTLVQCVRCPLALHSPHCLIGGCNVISRTQMVCYLHLRIDRKSYLDKHMNMDTCLECGTSGSLYCCDFCSSAYHKECMEEHQKPVEVKGEPDGKGEKAGVGEKWICPACRDHDLPTYHSIVLCKFGMWRWWPAQVVQMTEVPENIMRRKPGEGMFVVRFCGTRDYCWTYHGRTLSLSLEPGADPAKEVRKMCRGYTTSAPSVNNTFKNACKEAVELYCEQMKLQEEQQQKSQLKRESKAYIKIRANKYLVPRPPPSDDFHFLPCHCTPDHPCDDDSICVNRAIHIECNPKTCPVGPFCHNQRMQQCQYADTIPFLTGNRGWGLKAASDIEEGEFVVEYVGEVLDMAMCHERLQKAHENNIQHFYMLTLDSRNGLVIDAKEKSNHARFINHSCDPNCETQKWVVGNEARVGIFTKRAIKAGSELTFDYQLDSLGNGKKKCLCGSSNCSGFIGLRSKVEPKPKPKPKPKAKKSTLHRQTQPRPPPPDIPPVELTHENECFICGDGGDLLCCDSKNCRKVYHLECLGRKMVPSERWVCPRHFCVSCSKRAVTYCSTCPTSYCYRHRKKHKLTEVGGQLKCEQCSKEPSSSGGGGMDVSQSIPHSDGHTHTDGHSQISSSQNGSHSQTTSSHGDSHSQTTHSKATHSQTSSSKTNHSGGGGGGSSSRSKNSKTKDSSTCADSPHSQINDVDHSQTNHSNFQGSRHSRSSNCHGNGHTPIKHNLEDTSLFSQLGPMSKSPPNNCISLSSTLSAPPRLPFASSSPSSSSPPSAALPFSQPIHPIPLFPANPFQPQPLQLLVPPSNHQFLYYTQPFLSSPSAPPLMFPPSFHP